MTMYEFYTLTDRAIELLNRKAIQRFKDAQQQAALMSFDELTVIRTVKDLYSSLASDNRSVFLDLARAKYDETEPHGDEELDYLWLMAFLDESNPVTKYRYTTEIDRKRDYTAEAVIAATDKAHEYKRGLVYWGNFTAEYADLVTDAAALQAMKDVGVTEVVWHTEEDEKVCGECEPRDGKVYPIDAVPPKPHWRCRCWLTAKR